MSFHAPCSAHWHALKAKKQLLGALIFPNEITVLLTKLILLRRLYLVVMTMTADYAPEQLRPNSTQIRQVATKEALFRWCRPLQFAVLSFELEKNEELKLQEEQASFLAQMTAVTLWFSADILEYSDHPTPGFSAVKGQDLFAVLRNLKV